MIGAPHNGTATSRAAAASIKPHAHTLRQQIYDYIDSQSIVGATADEIEVEMGIPGNTIRPRLVELRKAGAIEDSGRTRETRSGREAVVYWTIPNYQKGRHA